MTTIQRVLLTLFCLGLVAGSSYAIEPAYTGQLGNPEEPALRPYKWFWRGAKALVYQTGTEFKEGNRDFPIVGTAYAFRGLRRGLVEWERSLWRGMAGSNNRTVHYKDVGPVNEYIEEDFLLRNAADLATAIYAGGLLTDSAPLRGEAGQMAVETFHVNGDAVKVGVSVFRMQKSLDRATPVPEWKKVEFKKPEDKCMLEVAQERYIGDRANINDKRAEGKGNFLKGAKRSRATRVHTARTTK